MGDNAFRFSGGAAASYERWLGPFLFEPSSILVSSMIPETYNGRILEVAAGTGRLTKHLASRLGAGGTLVATDLSDDMLALAREKINNPSVTFLAADAQALPFEDESFDMVICQYGLMFLPDKQKGFDEAFRVLRKGGRYIFTTWDDTSTMPVLDIVFGKIILPFFGTQTEKYLIPFHMHHPDILAKYLEQAGFTEIDVTRHVFEGHADHADQLVNGFLLQHSLGKEVAEKDPNALPHLAKTLHDQLKDRFGDGPFSCQLQAWIGQGVK